MKSLTSVLPIALLALGCSSIFGQSFNDQLAKAENGEVKAQAWIGNAYRSGLGVEADHKKAVEWYRKAAEQGLAEAQSCLADLLRENHDNLHDLAEAPLWFRKAAEGGDAFAQMQLAQFYILGKYGFPKSSAEAEKWLTKAAEQNNPYAQCELGRRYALGDGVLEHFLFNLSQGISVGAKLHG